METSTIGLDVAKNVFQVHGVDAQGRVTVQRKLRRGQVEGFFAKQPRCLVGIEACGSAHHWGRLLQAQGHEVRLLPPAYVKPYVKRNKTDARDAEAICEAVQRPTMRFVPIKSAAQQADRGLHRARDLLVRQRSQLGNSLRGLLGEYGIVARTGPAGLQAVLAQAMASEGPVPEALRPSLVLMVEHWLKLEESIKMLERSIAAAAAANPMACRLMAVPGVGPITAHAVIAAVPDPTLFRSGRDFAAWLGLTPREDSSADRRRQGAISRAGDGSVRRLLVLGAASLVRQMHSRAKKPADGGKVITKAPTKGRAWLTGLLGRRPVKVAIVAQAAKTARIIWALMAHGTTYRAEPAAA